ncbi:MAG: 3-deoxy-manno-octulosonate cytidylyltransferase [Deltaproteobacteria bacterium]|nr:3-deoxy-manno-octulosonate cytidylyltransferase [Deltaproteobacteria bacterium]
MRAVAVIPARYASTRFPGKPLAPLLGRPMIAWVIAAASRARSLSGVYVATDDEGIAEAARAAGAEAVLTSPDCASGSDRVAEAARSVEADVYVNLQGDEPLADPADVDALVAVFGGPHPPEMATLAQPFAPDAASDLWNPDVVKVVCAAAGDALYFSRAPIPHYRDAWPRGCGEPPAPGAHVAPLRHLGVYAYTRRALSEFGELPRGRLEQAESLEQLRALEAGWTIRVVRAVGESLGVDRPEDLPRAEAALRRRQAREDARAPGR